jgi:hypothetical protein
MASPSIRTAHSNFDEDDTFNDQLALFDSILIEQQMRAEFVDGRLHFSQTYFETPTRE